MTPMVFVEGESDKQFINLLLQDLTSGAHWRVAAVGGRNSMRPLSLRYLVVDRDPVAMVLDADTIRRDEVCEKQRSLEEYMRLCGALAPFELIQFVPEIEGLLFQQPTVLRRLLKEEVAPELLQLGRSAPREALKVLNGRLAAPYPELLSHLREEDLAELRTDPVVDRLRSFVMEYGGV